MASAYVKLKSCLIFVLAARNCRRTPDSATSVESRSTIIRPSKKRLPSQHRRWRAPPVPAPLEIGFHNGLAVRIGFIAAFSAVVMFLFPLPNPLLRLLAFLIAGILAVFLYTRRTGQMLTMRGGAHMGWITGIFSFLLVGVLATVSMVAIANQEGLAKFLSKQLPPNDARTETMVQMLQDPASLAAVVLFMLIVLFVIVTALPTIGGALGAKLFEKGRAES